MKSHGKGTIRRSAFASIGKNVIFERGALVFHPENIYIGDNVYIGHYAILKGYYKNKMLIGSGSWIGPQSFLHSAGGLSIGKNVGIGPGVKIITSHHKAANLTKPILHSGLLFKKVTIEDSSDIGVGTVILPGVTIAKGAIIGAGSVVTKDIPAHCIALGNPARVLRRRR